MKRSVVARASLAACGLLLMITATAAAQTKVGIVNLQKAVLDTGEIKKESAALEARFKPRTDELQKLQREIEEIRGQLEKGGDRLTPEAQSDLTLKGQLKQRQAQRLSEDLQGDLEEDRNAILQRASLRMQAVVSKLAEAEGLDVVFDVSNAIYFKPALDLTARATAEYDKAHPAQ